MKQHPHESEDGSEYVFTRDASREVDRLALEEFAIPSLVLMENAAIRCAEAALIELDKRDGGVLVACGPGNNGGDGLAIARHLHNEGVRLEVVLTSPPKAGTDAAVQHEIVRRMGITLHDSWAAALTALKSSPRIIIDALLGTGLTREPEAAIAAVIEQINRLHNSGAHVLSVDLPSGLDCDSGKPLGAAVRADTTVTFVGLKQGFLSLEAQGYIGNVVIEEISVPGELIARLGRLQRLGGSEGAESAGSTDRGGKSGGGRGPGR